MQGEDGLPNPAASTRVVLRPIANSFALGLLGLSGASMVLAAFQLRWIPADQQHQVGLILLVAAPIPQLVSAIFAFLGRDALGAGGMGWMSATWLAYGLIISTEPQGATSPALGVFLAVAAGGMIAIAGSSIAVKGLPAIVLGLAGLRFGCSTVHELVGSVAWDRVAGWAGVAVCLAALYAALALGLEDLHRRPILPTLRRGSAREMFDESLASQVGSVSGEAGVRRQL